MSIFIKAIFYDEVKMLNFEHIYLHLAYRLCQRDQSSKQEKLCIYRSTEAIMLLTLISQYALFKEHTL